MSVAGKPRVPSFWFCISQQAIKLHGPVKLIEEYKTHLQRDLPMIRSSNCFAALTPPLAYDFLGLQNPHNCGLEADAERLQAFKTSRKVFAMRYEQDSSLLKLWIQKILPSLFDLLDKAIGSDYSASLVREGATEQLSSAVIQVESPAMPAMTTKEDIRQNLERICNISLDELGLHLRFLRGALKLLAGGHSHDSEYEEDNNADCHRYALPHHARYWKYPGMGASIGLLCTEQEFATLGCYVKIDDDIF